MKTAGRGYLRGLALTLAVFALLLGAGCMLLRRVNASADAAQIEMVEKAVRNAALTCYAVEGAYPQDLAYLKTNYGLAYNERRFVVFYDAFASNILPEIRVNVRGEA